MLNTSQKKSDPLKNGINLQTVTLLAQLLKSGEINLSANDERLIQLIIKDKQLDLNIVDKKFLKELMKDNAKIKSFIELRKYLKTLAIDLNNNGVTTTISYQGVTMLTIGSNAKANFSKVVTGTKKIEINNLQKLIQLYLF